MNYINHNQTQANVVIQWGDPARGNHMPRLLDAPLPDLEADKTAKLAFELVATRPIRAGEEVFLDYGDAWEAAWQQHVKRWKPVENAESYISGDDLNATEYRLKTVFEQLEDPYPSNVELRCFEQFFHSEWIPWYEDGSLELEPGEGTRGIDILRADEQDDGEILYTIVDHDEDEMYEDLPRMAFTFVDKPHTTDMFLENAFRREIGIPDGMFPRAWRNLLDAEA